MGGESACDSDINLPGASARSARSHDTQENVEKSILAPVSLKPALFKEFRDADSPAPNSLLGRLWLTPRASARDGDGIPVRANARCFVADIPNEAPRKDCAAPC